MIYAALASAWPNAMRAIKRSLLMALVLGLFAIIGFRIWKPFRPQSRPFDKADVIVVLGGFSKDRVAEAVRLFEHGHAPKILVTGDEGGIVKDLLAKGIPEKAIIHENAARSTCENAEFSRPMLDAMGAKRAIIVTSWYHAGRALRIFQHLVPGDEFTIAYVPECDSSEKENDAKMAAREKFAIAHTLLFRFVPCLW